MPPEASGAPALSSRGRGPKSQEGWKRVPVQCCRQPQSLPTSLPQVPLCNRFEALYLEGKVGKDIVEGLPMRSCRKRQLTPCLKTKTGSEKKERRVIVVGDSLLRGTERPICRVDPYHREVCSLPRAKIMDITRTFPSLVCSTDYYPLLIFQTGGEEAASCSLRGMKKDFKALGWLVKESGAQVIFSSLLPFWGDDVGWNRRIQFINAWLHDWCHRQGFGFFHNGWFYKTPGLTLSDRWERFISQGQKCSGTGISMAHLESFKLDAKGDGVVAGLAPVGQHPNTDEDRAASHAPGVKSACSSRSLKCLYTNAHSMGNKQEELEIRVQSGDYDLVATTETWWDSSHDWNAVMDGSVLLRKDRPAR
uniref:Uncharacterized protein n=1 Tax=Anser brachyrhynchus TaxID=132585 RepID=A0A8B9I413_9AVES